MARAAVWYDGNDMVVELRSLRSSTMSSGTFLQNSGGVSYEVWSTTSTGTIGNRIQTGSMTYTGSSGRYRAVVQSTGADLTHGSVGMVKIAVEHGGITGEFRPWFRVDKRRST